MHNAQKAVALEAIKNVSADIALLASGDLQVTDERCLLALENLGLVKAFIESLDAPVAVKKVLNLQKTDPAGERVYYTSQDGLLYCFSMGLRSGFLMYLCNVKGELNVAVDAKSFAVDVVPMGDSSTAASFRAWANKHIEMLGG